jgi:hypothetical protein
MAEQQQQLVDAQSEVARYRDTHKELVQLTRTLAAENKDLLDRLTVAEHRVGQLERR